MSSIVCEYCDSVYARQALPPRAVARCQRCDATLYRSRTAQVDKMLAITVAAAIALAVAVTSPILSLSLKGSTRRSTVWDLIETSYDHGLFLAAVVVAMTLFLVPLLEIGLFLSILLPLSARRRPPHFVTTMHVLRLVRPWSMVEVFLLGVFVAVMKLSSLATVRPDAGVIGFLALTALLAALSTFDHRDLWDRADELRA